jgi:hypothetical protein
MDYEKSGMNEALNAIYDETLRLMPLAKANSELSQGLDLIRALAQYKSDIRSKDDIARVSGDPG